MNGSKHTIEKHFVRLFSKLYLPDIYRLDIPTTLLKPRDNNNSIEFYVIIIMNSPRDVIGAGLDDNNKKFLSSFILWSNMATKPFNCLEIGRKLLLTIKRVPMKLYEATKHIATCLIEKNAQYVYIIGYLQMFCQVTQHNKIRDKIR